MLPKTKKILIIAPLDIPISGNSTTIARLGKMLSGSSEFEITIKSCCITQTSAEAIPDSYKYDLIIGLHALRCAKWLLQTEGEFLLRKYPQFRQNSNTTSDGTAPVASPCTDNYVCHTARKCDDDDDDDNTPDGGNQVDGLARIVKGAPPSPRAQRGEAENVIPRRQGEKTTLKPFILIFGGTDVNEFSKDASSVALMRVAVDRAVKCVCFSSAIRDKALEVFSFPTNSNDNESETTSSSSSSLELKSKFIIISQTVDEEIWTICQKLIRFDHFETRPDRDAPREIDQIIYEAQKMQFERDENFRQQQNASRNIQNNSTASSQTFSRKISNDEKNANKQEDSQFRGYGWTHSDWLSGDSATRWIVMPAGVRQVKNQLTAVEMVVELNRLSMRRELEGIYQKLEGKNPDSDGEKMSNILKNEDAEQIGSVAVAHDVEQVLDTLKKEGNDQKNAVEWGLLLLGPEIDAAYGELIDIATSWYLDKHQANTVVVWHRTGISAKRLCTLLFDKCNKIAIVLNSSRSEGQPQAIMEAMVVCASQRQQEEMMAMDDVKNDKKDGDDDDENEEQGKFVCAVSDCPGNLAVVDESCGIVLPLNPNENEADNDDVRENVLGMKWAKIIHDRFVVDESGARKEQVARMRENARRRAIETMQPIQEEMAWKRLVVEVLEGFEREIKNKIAEDDDM